MAEKILAVHGYEIYQDGTPSKLCDSVCRMVVRRASEYDLIFLLAGQHLQGAPTTVDRVMRKDLLGYGVPEQQLICWSNVCPQFRPPRDTMEETDIVPSMLRAMGYHEPRLVPFDVAGICYYEGYIMDLYRNRRARVGEFLGAESTDFKRKIVAGIGHVLSRIWPDGDAEIFRKNRAARNVFLAQPTGKPWRDNVPSAWEAAGDVLFFNTADASASTRKWIIYKDQPIELLRHDQLGVKDGRYPKGDCRSRENASASTKWSLMIVHEGSIRMTFRPDEPEEETHLIVAGYSVLWGPGVRHFWEAVEDSHTTNVEWP